MSLLNTAISRCLVLTLLGCSLCLAEELEIKPLRIPEHPGILEDIDSQAINPACFREKDLITSGHELSHSVASRIRSLVGPNKNGFYILNGRAVFFTKPPITISTVARQIPPSLHNHLYKLYLVQGGKDWDKNSLYLMDEANSYLLGGEVAVEYKIVDRLEITCKYGWTMFWYCGYLLREIEHRKVEYTELDDLAKFWQQRVERLYAISPASATPATEGLTKDEVLIEWMYQRFGVQWVKKYIVQTEK